MAVKRYLKCKKGQAVIETAMALPLLIWLLFYTLNTFNMVHTTHVSQRYAAMNMYQRLQNRAKFSVDAFGNGLIPRRTENQRDFIAVQYNNPDGRRPVRNILELGNNTQIRTVVGICKEPGCN